MKKKSMSIKLRITIIFLLLFSVMTGVFIRYLISISSEVYLNTETRNLKDIVTKNLSYIEGIQEGHLVISEGFLYEMSGINVVVYSENASVIAGQPPTGFAENIKFENGVMRRVRDEDSDFFVLDVFYPFDWDSGVWIRGIDSLSNRENINKNLFITAMISLPVFLAVAGVLLYLISRRAFKPLDRINESISKINDGEDLSARLNISSGAEEFVELSKNVDLMLSRLERAFENEKRFTSDVSHELRTPVSVIKGAAEYSLKYDDSKEEFKESLEMIKRNSDDMSEMIETLLDISRLEQKSVTAKHDKVDLSGLMEEICQERELIPNGKGILLNKEIKENVTVISDGGLIKRMLLNLIENAYKYGKDSGKVWVSLKEDSDCFEISVRDDGVGIPVKNQPFIFDRFYRVDASREEIPGTGLGLSMVKTISDIMGYEIKLESVEGIGTNIRILIKK